ncbi:MAG: histidine phosphatase family protein [Pseudomonadota bacterium]
MKTYLALVRHGPTEWNARRKVQGWTDIPLSDAGRETVRGWRLPSPMDGWRVVSSPLNRAVETAQMLTTQSFTDPPSSIPTIPDLREMRWGQFEGEELEALRARFGDVMAEWEAQGLDFKAPDGESPRELQGRLRPVFQEIGQKGENTIAFCHKGVIRAAFAGAIGWDMTGKPPDKVRDGHFFLFAVSPDGALTLEQANVPLREDGLEGWNRTAQHETSGGAEP